MLENIYYISMIRKDDMCIVDVRLDCVVSFLFQGYDIIQNSLDYIEVF